MKKQIILSTLLIASLLMAHGQEISAQSFIQQTVMGFQKGYGVRVQTNKGLGLGLLFQSNGKITFENPDSNYPFIGAEAIIPLTKCGDIRFYFTPKAGFVNRNYFVIIPEVETVLKINKHFSAAIMAGLRSRESSVGAKLIFTIK